MKSLTFMSAVCIVCFGCDGPHGDSTTQALPSASSPQSVASAASSASTTLAASSSATGNDAQSPRVEPTRQGNAIARSPENDALYVVDEDHRRIHALSLPAELKSKHVEFQTPGAPAQVLPVGDRLLVTVRQVNDGQGGLFILKRKGVDIVDGPHVELPVDAWGVAVTPDQTIAIVTSAWTHKVSAVDLATNKVLWSVDAAREPRGIVVIPGGEPRTYRAYISHLIGSDVTRLDFAAGAEPTVKRIELPAAPLLSPPNTQLPASLGYAVAASPKGDRVYFPRIALGALGPAAWFGADSVDVLSTAADTPRAPYRNAVPTANFIGFVTEEMSKPEGRWSAGANPVIDSPWWQGKLSTARAVVYRHKTNTLLVASEGNNKLIELDALAMAPTLGRMKEYSTEKNTEGFMHLPTRGGAPAGVALSEDEDEAYVYCRATNDVVIVRLLPATGSYKIAPPIIVSLDTAPDKLLIGRTLFYSSSMNMVSEGMACAGCHPEGRDDGFTWREAKITMNEGRSKETFTNFLAGTDMSSLHSRWGDFEVEGDGGVGYARQTPMIAGRIKAAGPYGWHGESKTINDRVAAGFGLHRWQTSDASESMRLGLAAHIVAFIREGLVPPPKVTRPLTEEEQRGKTIFTSPATQCATCHAPQTEYTDRIPFPLKALKPPATFAEDPNLAYKTPSLLYVGGTAPYMHDGRFSSLETLIEFNQDRMGKTSQLSADDRKALIAFLRTL